MGFYKYSPSRENLSKYGINAEAVKKRNEDITTMYKSSTTTDRSSPENPPLSKREDLEPKRLMGTLGLPLPDLVTSGKLPCFLVFLSSTCTWPQGLDESVNSEKKVITQCTSVVW